MTTVTYSTRLNSCVYQMFASLSRRLILRRSLARLEQLDDHLLKDIGLSREFQQVYPTDTYANREPKP
jgi:Domain of unknown function (DUF1127)